MSDSNKSYRIRTKVGAENDSVLSVDIEQDIDTIEILSMKIGIENAYKLQASNYGCIAGRVLANGNFGIQNAKISVFIEADEEDLEDTIISQLYPYKSTSYKNSEGIRYNLLPDEEVSQCHQSVGTFPSKKLVLSDDCVLEVFDKYYKYTTVTNQSGDYLIFGVPVGNHTIHTDIDLSDIGILSQKPIDMQYKGYNRTMFENSQMFKKDTNIDNLAQIISDNSSVYVYPFWGENDEIGAGVSNNVKITRHDIEIQYKFEPTCIFLGSIFTDEKTQGISKECVPSLQMGKMDTLECGEGTIEMIRKTPDGSIEQFVIQGDQLINGDGVWCYQIPMNLDYIMTDEFGNIVPTDNPNKGIPTRTSVRFRMSLNSFENDYVNNHLCKVLVPHNPKNAKDGYDYEFGSYTSNDSFRDLLWNKVYTVKSYIPRIQHLDINWSPKFTGIKDVSNVINDRNSFPYNNIRVNISFTFRLQCVMMKILIRTVSLVNKLLGVVKRLSLGIFDLTCVRIGDGACPDLEGWYFAPGCNNDGIFNSTYNEIVSTQGSVEDIDTESTDYQNQDREGGVCLTSSTDYLMKCIEMNLAMERNVIQFDFYNDWVNGTIYTPRWFALKPKKSKFRLLNNMLYACTDYKTDVSRRLMQACVVTYSKPTSGDSGNSSFYTLNARDYGCSTNKYLLNSNRLTYVPASSTAQKCHKVKIHSSVFGKNGGLVHKEETLQNKNVYYIKPCEWNGSGSSERKTLLFATDIVLLGSMNENDLGGIPQTFKSLPATTFRLPQNNLVTTNIENGGIFGSIDGKSRCDSATRQPVQMLPKTLSSFKRWDSTNPNASNNDDVPNGNNDVEEIGITEESGIDWGISGPGQGENSFKDLYFPGGHFIGLSCANSEVNIKSCINLYRACEVGSSMSSRYEIPKFDGDNIEEAFIIPTGLISGNNIIDSNVRSEFASMNYNELKTVTDGAFAKYALTSLYPNNFNGELRNIIGSGTPYEQTSGETATEFKRSIERASDDYYKFRFGLQGSGSTWSSREGYKIEQKYLGISGNKSIAAFPIYENSFYFYFGLRNGLTAIDKFFKEYFSECRKKDVYDEPSITLDKKDITADYCGGSNGSVTATVKNFKKPGTVSLIKSDDNTVVESYALNGNTYTFNGLSGDTRYRIEVVGANMTKAKEFFVSYNYGQTGYDKISDNLEIEEFVQSTYYNISDTAETINHSGGTIQSDYFKTMEILVVNENGYFYDGADSAWTVEYVEYLNGKDPVLISGVFDRTEGKIYGWKSNSDYTIFVKSSNCDRPFKIEPNILLGIKDDTFSLCLTSYNYNLRDYFAQYRKTYEHMTQIESFDEWLNRVSADNGWYIPTLREQYNMTQEQKWAFRKSVAAQDSFCNLSPESLKIYPIGGTSPYTFNYKPNSYAEKISGDTVSFGTIDSLSGSTNFSHQNFIGSEGITKIDDEYHHSINISGIPHAFFIKFLDNDTPNELTIGAESVYNPFFFNAVLERRWNNVNGFVNSFNIAIMNGISVDSGAPFECTFGNTNVQLGGGNFIRNNGTGFGNFTYSGTSFEHNFSVTVFSGNTDYGLVSENGSIISVSESVPEDETAKNISCLIPKLAFFGDENPNNENVRYYCLSNIINEPDNVYHPLSFNSGVSFSRIYPYADSGNTVMFDYVTSGSTEVGKLQWLGSLAISNYEVGEFSGLTHSAITDFNTFISTYSGQTGQTAEVSVIGVYDQWVANPSNSRWENVYAHTNMVSIITRYSVEDFISLLIAAGYGTQS